MNIAFFTAGTIGAGHLMRGLAIGRGLERAGRRHRYRMFGPPLPFPACRRLVNYEAVEIETDAALRHPQLAQTSDLGRRLAAFRPDLLLVDLFWAPLHWLLPALGCEAWLLLRTCPAAWLIGPPAMSFDAGRFARLLAIEPFARGATAPALDSVEPVVIANPDECLPAGALRERVGAGSAEELVAVVHAGQRRELDLLLDEAAAGGGTLHVFDLHDGGAPFPIATWLGGAGRIVCGAGYNAYWEARWLGFAARTRFVPFPRSIDDQGARLAAGAAYTMRANGADTLARLIG